MSLRKRAIKVKLNISAWKGMKKDSQVEGEVAAAHKIKGKAGKWQGNLFPACDEELKMILDAETALRGLYYSKTRKWNDNEQILTSEQFLPFVEEMSKLRGLFEQRVDTFLNVYDERVEQAMQNRGSLASRIDYPTKDEVKEKFEVRLQFFPLEDSGDFRLEIPEEAEEKLVKQLDEGVAERLQECMKDSKERLVKALQNALINLNKVKGSGRYRGEWYTNLQELLEVAESFNLADDAEYSEAVKKVKDAFAYMDEEAIEEDSLCEGSRKQAANAVQKIMDDMSSFFGVEA